MFKRTILGGVIIAALYSCGSSSDVKEFEVTNDTYSEQAEAATEMIQTNPNAFQENLTTFQECKSSANSPADCKEFLAKAVCEYYGIEDLKEGGNYIDYDKIPAKLKELDTWQKVGDFNEENIQIALEQLNGFSKPVLVFNSNDSYVHVVALLPNGNVIKSRKWGDISVPACVSYFPTRPNKSFIKNGINYAFGAADGLEIWMKN